MTDVSGSLSLNQSLLVTQSHIQMFILTLVVAAGSNPPGLEPHPVYTTETERETDEILISNLISNPSNMSNKLIQSYGMNSNNLQLW